MKRIHQAILAYEPRVIRHSLQVSWVSRTEAPLFEIQMVIEGQLRDAEVAHPFTFSLHLEYPKWCGTPRYSTPQGRHG